MSASGHKTLTEGLPPLSRSSMAPPTLAPGPLHTCSADLCPRFLHEPRDYRTPPATNLNRFSFTDDPGLIVALCITGLVLLFGFGIALFSAGPWKRLRKNAARRKARPQYLKSPKPLPRLSTSAPWLEYPVLPEINISSSPAPLCTREDLLRFSLSIPPGSPPIRDQTPSTPTRLFPVIEVDEESDDEPTIPPQCQDRYSTGVEQVSADHRVDIDQPPEVEDSEESLDTTAGRDIFDTESQGSEASLASPDSSIHDTEIDEDSGDSELDIVDDAEIFELKRGQTQSLELIKGVLVTLPPGASSVEDIWGIKTNNASPAKLEKAMLRSRTCPNIRTHWSPSVPAVIVTQPSTLSLYTLDSSTSDLSLSNDAVPIPPLHLEPAVFWQRLEEEINQNLAIRHKRR
jgi:hypothetical protein